MLRKMLDNYLDYPPKAINLYKKQEILGMKVLPRTISREHDRKLRGLHNTTGRSMSEMMRQAVQAF